MDPSFTLSWRIKLIYGVGRAAEGIKTRAFEFFLFFYYVQVLGLPGSLAGLAVGIALIADAVTDPLVGSISDNLRSRFGRRHPLMYASVPPLGITFFLLFAPPGGLGQMGLFIWLTVFSVLARTAITFFHVPHLSLGAELSSHYTERSSIVATRTVFGAIGSVICLLAGMNYYFGPSAAFANGQLDPSRYPPFAIAMALLMSAAIMVSAIGTHGLIPSLPRATDNNLGTGLIRMLREMKQALANTSFRALFVGLLFFYIVVGTHATLGLHMSTYYWELTQAQISSYVLAGGAGFVAGLMLLRRAHERIDKKLTFVIGAGMLVILAAIGPSLREIGYFPGNDHPALFPLLLFLVLLVAFFAALSGVSGGSMMADIADEHELTSGRRQEGIFFGAASFAGKSASAFGHILAGVAIDLIAFPVRAEPGTIPSDKLTELGLFNGPMMALVMAVGVIYFTRYNLTRHRHAEILQTLRERSAVADVNQT